LAFSDIKFIEGIVIGGPVVAIIRPRKSVSYIKPFAIDGIQQLLIVSMHFMNEGSLVAFCNVQ